MNHLYGTFGNQRSSIGVDVPDSFYSHPAIRRLEAAQRKLDLIQTLLDEVLLAVPETPSKGAAVMHMHTASMWMDKAMSQGYAALRTAYAEMDAAETKRKADVNCAPDEGVRD